MTKQGEAAANSWPPPVAAGAESAQAAAGDGPDADHAGGQQPDAARSNGETVPDLQPGQLSFGWRVALFIVWLLVIAGLSSVWQLTVQIGHHTVWLGPPGEPRPIVVQLLVFSLPAIAAIAVVKNHRWTTQVGVIVGIIVATIGVVDLGIYRNLGLVEIAIGVCAAVASWAARAGRAAAT